MVYKVVRGGKGKGRFQLLENELYLLHLLHMGHSDPGGETGYIHSYVPSCSILCFLLTFWSSSIIFITKTRRYLV